MGNYIHVNLNPKHKRVGDCVVRAISEALGQSWHETYIGICVQGALDGDMPDGNKVWGHYLTRKGFIRKKIPDSYPPDYDVEDFAMDNPRGTYILAIDGHVVCIKDGKIYDSWYSGEEHPAYVWHKEGT